MFIDFILIFVFMFKDFIYLFLDGGERKEKERERNINVWLCLACPRQGTWPATQACALTGNWTGDPVVCRPALSPRNHTSQGFLIFLGLSAFEMEDPSLPAFYLKHLPFPFTIIQCSTFPPFSWQCLWSLLLFFLPCTMFKWLTNARVWFLGSFFLSPEAHFRSYTCMRMNLTWYI